MEYPYRCDEPLAARIRYSYAPYGGEAFMDAWRADRQTVKASLPAPALPPEVDTDAALPAPGAPVETAPLLEAMYATATAGDVDGDAFRHWLARLTGKFETTGRLHDGYDADFRAVDKTRHGDVALYVRFGEILCATQTDGPQSARMNTLLKLMDVLTSLAGEMDEPLGARTAALIDAEAALTDALIARISRPA